MGKKRLIILLIIIFIFLVSIILSFLYYEHKIEVSFETGTEEKILPKYINSGEIIDEPPTPIKDGYIFINWLKDNEEFNFNTPIYENITLSANWIKEEYINIRYITNSNYEIESIKILKGSNINNLPDAFKDGYEFIGWYINDKLYNNEIVNDDTILIAHYKNDDINTTYKVGDKVLITSSYSDSAYSKYSYNFKAIGWYREILKIYENSNYPYMVGDFSGTTGFFKASSISVK